MSLPSTTDPHLPFNQQLAILRLNFESSTVPFFNIPILKIGGKSSTLTDNPPHPTIRRGKEVD